MCISLTYCCQSPSHPHARQVCVCVCAERLNVNMCEWVCSMLDRWRWCLFIVNLIIFKTCFFFSSVFVSSSSFLPYSFLSCACSFMHGCQFTKPIIMWVSLELCVRFAIVCNVSERHKHFLSPHTHTHSHERNGFKRFFTVFTFDLVNTCDKDETRSRIWVPVMRLASRSI